ncbi:YeeE/YedE family protein [Roseicyclus sp. F158]|uniref:YeeE/YedE family protein n=1 Tax=Tropicimonas omnivorans TaxID=3075590 RepID=A0ABU3DHN9_9RHOB|nr:YeeE/YedE family protein [Roseicyclus sp. F158]MDT0683236.1 YeeE/YedE family protein [Roseicyclus sp. F158]
METNAITPFTPLASLGGGVMIGLSAVMVMALFGRIAGIAGITRGTLGAILPGAGGRDGRDWRATFLLGLLAAPVLVTVAGGGVPQTVPEAPLPMILAGLLVGVGTALGSGCTSGHGVCGLARLSRRSFAAVGTFMVVAFATVFVLRHALGAA